MTAQTTTSATTAPLASQLAEREAELNALQANFDDYIESSRLLEEELENELEKTQKELSTTKHSLSSLQSTQHTSLSQLSHLEQRISTLTSSLSHEKQLRLTAEIASDKSQSHARQYESRYNVLKEECDAICETLAFRDAECEDLRVELEREREGRREVEREVGVLRQRVEEGEKRRDQGEEEKKMESSNNTNDSPPSDSNDDADPNYTKQLEQELEIVSSQLLSTRQQLKELETKFIESERGRNEMEDCVTCAKQIIDDSYVDDEEDEEDVFERTRRGGIEEMVSGDDDEEVGEDTGSIMEEGDDERVLLLMKEKEELAEELKLMQDTTTQTTTALEDHNKRLSAEIATLRNNPSSDDRARALIEENEMMKEELELLHQALEDDKKTLTDENSRLKEELELLYEELSLTQEDLTEKINEKQERIEEFETKLDQLTISLDEAKNEKNKEALRVIELDKELQMLNEQHEEMRETYHADMKSLKAQREELMEEIKLLKLRDVAKTHELLTSHKMADNEKTQQQHEDNDDKTGTTNAKNDEMPQQYETTMKLLRAQNEELREEVGLLEDQLKEMKKRFEMLNKTELNIDSEDKNDDKMDVEVDGDDDITPTTPKSTTKNNKTAPSPLTKNLISSLRSQLARSQSQASMSQQQLRDAQSELSQTRQMLAQVKAKVDHELGNTNNQNNRGRKRQRGDEGNERVVRSHSPMGYKHHRTPTNGNDDDDDAKASKNELQLLVTQLQREKTRNATLLTRLLHQSSRIQVCCRIKPSSSSQIDALNDVEVGLFDSLKRQWRSYGMDRVWGESVDQEGVWMDVEPLCSSVLEGGEACVLAYGQTGSGKTYTMEGTPDNHGISYRTINKLFQLITHKNKLTHDSSQHYELSLSMLEIYNEEVHDLLSPPSSSPNNNTNKRPSLDIRCTSTNQIQIPHLTSLPISNARDIPTLLSQGHANRATAYTNLNEHSSRSHMVLTLFISSSSSSSSSSIGRLSLVDLAGSERLHKSHVTGIQLKEAQHINKSLSALGDVMEALDKKSSHVPYRNSKLTYLLQNALGGNGSSCRTMMVVTINPEFLEETRYALQFAQRVRRIDIPKSTSGSAVAERNYEERVKSLRRDVSSITKAKERLEKQLSALRTDHGRLTERLGVMEKEREMLRGEKGEVRGWKEEREELVGRWQKEKSLREERGVDLENCHKELRRVQQQLQRANKERDVMSKRQLSFENELATVRKELRQAREYKIDNNNNNNLASVGVTTPNSKAKSPKKQLSYSSPVRHQYHSTTSSSIKTPPPTPPTPSHLTKKRSLKPPQPPITSSPSSSSSSTRDKIITILKTHEPSRLNRLDSLLDKFQNREDVLLRKLESRYDSNGTTARSSTESVGTTASSSSPSSSPQTMVASRRMELAMERHKERMRNFRNES